MTSSTTLPRPAASGKPSAKPLRVLYADDMKELRDLMGIVLGNEGHKLETCGNGALACEQLRRTPATYDLLITDHHMPVMTGLELVREVRHLPFEGRIIVFSSELSQSVHDEYAALGVDRVLAKPVLPRELRQLLAEMFPAA
jgi:two-component system, chemotaxis family, chemotaxis protein CheY